MILGAFLRALGQLGDPAFRRVLWLGLGLTLLLLAGVSAAFVTAIDWFVADTLTLPWIGEVSGIDRVLGWGSLILMIGLSVVLMVPVAALFSGFFLETVAAAVEDRHYPDLPPAVPLTPGDALASAAGLFGLLIAANLAGLIVLPFAGPLAPLVFWAVNGLLLGREYFDLAASRRLGRVGARDLRRANRGRLWLAGTLMAAPLSIPLVNLLVPVLGAATFTHIFHALNGTERP